MKTTASEQIPLRRQATGPLRDASWAKRLGRLALALAAFWFIVHVLAPLPVKYFGPMRDYAEIVDRMGITPGALYYSDVDQSLESETNNRDAIHFFVNRANRSGG